MSSDPNSEAFLNQVSAILGAHCRERGIGFCCEGESIDDPEFLLVPDGVMPLLYSHVTSVLNVMGAPFSRALSCLEVRAASADRSLLGRVLEGNEGPDCLMQRYVLVAGFLDAMDELVVQYGVRQASGRHDVDLERVLQAESLTMENWYDDWKNRGPSLHAQQSL